MFVLKSKNFPHKGTINLKIPQFKLSGVCYNFTRYLKLKIVK